jgi:uncharacterized membrane protein
MHNYELIFSVFLFFVGTILLIGGFKTLKDNKVSEIVKLFIYNGLTKFDNGKFSNNKKIEKLVGIMFIILGIFFYIFAANSFLGKLN